MNIIERVRLKLEIKKKGMQDTIQRGREVTEQMKAESLRKKNEKVVSGNPSAMNTVRRHLIMRTKNPLDVMKDEFGRRKYEREKD